MKKRVLKNWVVQILSGYLALWVVFLAITIESMGNAIYDKVLIISTMLAIVSFLILNKYSYVFQN